MTDRGAVGSPEQGASDGATLFLVSTPIGNLGDLTHRAVEILGAVEVVFAEDTRRSRVLLERYGIHTRLVALHQHNEAGRALAVLRHLSRGEDVALVSDAGTPLISDPGERLVQQVVSAGHTVIPVPGPSSAIAALVASGLPSATFTFLGFPPRKGKARSGWLERVADSEETCVLFEAPGRLERLLADLARACGDDRPATVAREMTKLHEEHWRGTLASLHVRARVQPPKGEVTVVVAPGSQVGVSEVQVREEAQELLAEGLSASRAAKALSDRLGIPRNRAYRVVQSVTISEKT